MKRTILQQVQIVDPSSPFHLQVKDLILESGYIAEIADLGTTDLYEEDEVWQGNNACVSPGWVDMMVHLSDPGYEYRESLSQLSHEAFRGGFTHILCYPETSPSIDNASLLYALSKRTESLPVQFHLAGTATLTKAGRDMAELHDMYLAGAKAFSDGIHNISATGVFDRLLQYLKTFNGLLIHYPGIEDWAQDGQMNEGMNSVSLGMKGIPEIAELIGAQRDLSILQHQGGKLHLQPLSSPQALNYIDQYRKNYPAVTTAVCSYHLAFDDSFLEQFDSNYKVYPPLRSLAQIRDLKDALSSGYVDAIVSGHLALSTEEKNMEFQLAESGMMNLQTSFSLAYQHLVEEGIINLTQLIELISINPRIILDLPQVVIQKGEVADLSLFQPGKEWTFRNSNIMSRSSNTPLINQTLRGQVLGTYFKGRLRLITF